MSEAAFSTEQQEYLKGFMSGVEARRGALGLPMAPGDGAAAPDPSDLQRAAQDTTISAGGKLTAEEKAKRKKHPLDRWDEISSNASDGVFPRGTDVFLTKYHGLFYVGPAHGSFMCRLRIPGGVLTSHQLHGVAAIAAELGGGYADITTRANLQIREISAAGAPEVLIRLAEIGLTSRGAGADNVRNITGSPTAGIDPQELIDTRLHARAIHHFILNHRELCGLPRKFNIAFDGGGCVPVLEETNDIAFTAVRVAGGYGVAAGVYYRLALGGITGHGDFARMTDIVVPPDATTPVCNAILRVFIREGERTDRRRARLKYVLDRLGIARFIAAVERELDAPFARVPLAALLPRAPALKHGHVGIHPQLQAGLNYIGVVCPVGRLGIAQLQGLADIAARFGSATLRLTVWQNLLISDIPDAALDAACAAIVALGLAWKASHIRGGLVACTGSAGCKFAAGNTKAHAAGLADWLDDRITLDAPINIHLTGCHHSCAQHFIADIGLLATKIERGDDFVEGYDLHVGGGAGPAQAIGRLIRKAIAFEALPEAVLALLRAWQGEAAPGSFQDWCAARSDDALAALSDRVAVNA